MRGLAFGRRSAETNRPAFSPSRVSVLITAGVASGSHDRLRTACCKQPISCSQAQRGACGVSALRGSAFDELRFETGDLASSD
jgi:hypothetical protein